jgi:DNA-binding NtrC family response regulator
MSEPEIAPDERQRVLLVLNTGHRYAMHYFEALLDIGCAPEVTSYKGDEIKSKIGCSFEVLVHMGLGDKEERMHGLELVQHANELFPGVPILVLSGHDASYALPEVLRRGAADFLHRPDRSAESNVPSADDIAEFLRKVQQLLLITGAKIE